MAKFTKMHIAQAITMLVLVLLALSPNHLGAVFSDLFGKMFLLGLIIFLAMNNVMLGLIGAVILILGLSVSRSGGIEGLVDMSGNMMKPISLPEVSIPPISIAPMLLDASSNASVTSFDTSGNSMVVGTDKISVEQQFRGPTTVSSNLPVTPPTSTETVAPTSKESFTSMYSKW